MIPFSVVKQMLDLAAQLRDLAAAHDARISVSTARDHFSVDFFDTRGARLPDMGDSTLRDIETVPAHGSVGCNYTRAHYTAGDADVTVYADAVAAS